MRFVVQRVLHASVTVDGRETGKIGKGFLVLIGISKSDSEEDADRLVSKLLKIRLFEDEHGKTNLSLSEYIIKKCSESMIHVETGQFGADMKVELLNDGPFTVIIE